jgi:hypothetical protein
MIIFGMVVNKGMILIMSSEKLKKEYVKLELLHSQLDELINGNTLTTDELKILQSFVEDMREKHFTKKGILKYGKL